jgi:hypothetical protein
MQLRSRRVYNPLLRPPVPELKDGTDPAIKNVVDNWLELRETGEWDNFARLYRDAYSSGLVTFLHQAPVANFWEDSDIKDRFIDLFENEQTRQLQVNPRRFTQWYRLIGKIANIHLY